MYRKNRISASRSNTRFFCNQPIYKQHQAKTAQKNQANAKQQPETELLLF